MTSRDFNRGLDDAANGEDEKGRQHPDYYEGYRLGAREPAPQPEPQMPSPEPADICAGNGHPYYGDDEQGERCYCGERRVFSVPWVEPEAQA